MALESVRIRLRSRRERPTTPGRRPVLVCRAPSASMYLDQRGDVRACCQNAGFPLGNVTEQSLLDIWHGPRAQRLREAVAADDLSLGCSFCEWQAAEGADQSFARTFDHLEPGGAEPAWPQQLELSMSNACNLQCVMCNGEWSSAIRTHREGLPPLPTVYDDRFFEELAEFLPHLEVVKFLGGEPFLSRESLRVMEMLAELDTGVAVHVTTNCTQWSPRIERILDRLDVHVVVSLDGARAATYERIRVGASFDRVLDHLDRFSQRCRERGTSFSISHCLMTANWHEFDELLDLAESRGCDVWVNTVTEPHDLSLFHLRPEALREVVAELDGRVADAGTRWTGVRAAVWDDQRDRLRRHLRSLEEGRPPSYVAKRRHLGFAWLAPTTSAEDAGRRLDEMVEHEQGWMVHLDDRGLVDRLAPHGVPSDRLSAAVREDVVPGSPLPAALDVPGLDGDGSVVAHDLRSRRSELPVAGGEPLDLFVTRVAVRAPDGVIEGVRTFVAERRAFHVATDLADGSEHLAGYLVDADGTVSQVDGAATGFLGADPQRLVGRGADEIEDALVATLGDVVGAPVDLSDGAVVQRRTVHVDAAGVVVALHRLVEPSGDATRTWLVRVADAGTDEGGVGADGRPDFALDDGPPAGGPDEER